MEHTGYPAIKWLSNYTRSTFLASSRRHLLIIGGKGRGKTTLLEALLEHKNIPGLRSGVERGADGIPALVWLEERSGLGRCVIGQRTGAAMEPVPGVLDKAGVELARTVLTAPGEWVAVDEIGFLEQSSPAYQQALWSLFEQKRVLAALRKEDLPFLNRLRARADCFILDLDEVREP